jgi:subtilisin family serine protease
MADSSSGYGVAKGADLIAMNVMSFNDSTPRHELVRQGDLIAALQRVYAIRSTYSVAAVNMSIVFNYKDENNVPATWFSGSCDSSFPSLTTAIGQLTSAGITVIGASGNAGGSGQGHQMPGPACITDVLAVGAVTKLGTDAGYSNASSMTDLLAPGGTSGSCPSDQVETTSVSGGGSPIYSCTYGTSIAAPHVAGAIAILKAESPSASVSDLVDQLVSSGSPLSISRNSVQFSIPVLDVDTALDTPSQPSSLDVQPQYCFGKNHLAWAASSGQVTRYEVQGSSSPSYTSPVSYHSGMGTSKNITVSGTTYMRIRACNGLFCSAWRNGDEAATYTTPCL